MAAPFGRPFAQVHQDKIGLLLPSHRGFGKGSRATSGEADCLHEIPAQALHARESARHVLLQGLAYGIEVQCNGQLCHEGGLSSDWVVKSGARQGAP